MDLISENLKVVIIALIGLFAGIAITIRVQKKKKTDKSNTKTTQTGNTAGGDIAGRDINK